MIRKFAFYGTFSLVLLASSSALSAANLYRYTDENGVTTLSKTLPAEYAQKGYHILDDKTMRVIERVPRALTQEEIAELEAQQAAQAEQARLAAIKAEAEAKARQKQADEDRKLLLTYPTEEDLLSAKANEISYREEQIIFYESKLPDLQVKLENAQKNAAERELSGQPVTDNMKKQLESVKQDISMRHEVIDKYKAEIDALNMKFDKDLARHRELHSKAR